MKSLSISILLLFITIFGFHTANGENPEPLQELASLVIADTLTVKSEPAIVPTYIMNIVCDYYAESTIDDAVPNNVLDYITGVYQEHGYYETGYWGRSTIPKRSSYHYVPYKGELPEYRDEDFTTPVDGSITSHYGYRPKFGRFHRGVDIALNSGDTVCCSLPGVVIKTGYDSSGYGRYVVVAHDRGMETLYGHLQVSLVSPGNKLAAGAPIGLGGATGNATGAHLHFETRYRGVPIDPAFLLNRE